MSVYTVVARKRFALDFVVRKSDGTIENITGAIFRFVAKRSARDIDADAVLNLTSAGGAITITDAATGKVRVAAADGWGPTLPPSRLILRYDLQMTRSGGDGPYVIDRGSLIVELEVGVADPA